MQRISTVTRVFITGSIAGVILLSGSTLNRLTTSEAIYLAIALSIIIGMLQYVSIRAERIESTIRSDRLHSVLTDIRGQQNITHARLEQIIKALGHTIPAVHLSGKIELQPLDVAYILRHRYESRRSRRWMYLLGLRKSLSLYRSRDQLTPSDEEALLVWLKDQSEKK